MAIQELAGGAAGQATASAALNVVKIAGRATGQATASAGLSVAKTLVGAPAGVATASATLTADVRSTAGSAAGRSTVSGLLLTGVLTGSALGQSTASAGLTVTALDRADLVLTVALTQGSLVNSPGVLVASVGNGAPDGSAHFFIDNGTTAFYVATLDGTGAARQIYLPISLLPAELYMLRVSPTASPPPAGTLANVEFRVVSSNDTFLPMPVVVQIPPVPVVPNRWVFQAYDFSDINAVDTYVLPVNPSVLNRSFGSIDITDEATVVSNGLVISWEGVRKPPQWTLEGSLLTKDQFRQMTKWGLTGQRFYMTDDFGDRYLVKCVSYAPKRRLDVNRVWNHTYTMTVAVLKGVGVYT